TAGRGALCLGQDEVVAALAGAEQDGAAKEGIVHGQSLVGVGPAAVVDVKAALGDEGAGGAFGARQAAGNQRLPEGQPGGERGAGGAGGGDGGGEMGQHIGGEVVHAAAEEDAGSGGDMASGGLAMDERGDLEGQLALADAAG